VHEKHDQSMPCRCLFTDTVAVINIGLEHMVEPLARKGIAFVQLDWRPPASGKKALLDKIRKITKES